MDQQEIIEDVVKDELDNKLCTSKIKVESTSAKGEKVIEKDQNDLKYFECVSCSLKEKFEYFGKEPPFFKNYKLEEEAYVIEDPFLPPKCGKVLILGAHCIQCNKLVCKNTNCSIYFKGTFCIECAKNYMSNFPKAVQEKLNRIVI